MGSHMSRAVAPQNFPLELINPYSLYRVIYLLLQTGQSPLGGEQGRPNLKGGRGPTACIIQLVLL